MLFDLEMSAISSKQLGQHAAHHLWQCIMQDLSALPAVEVTLQQVRGQALAVLSAGAGSC